MAQIRPNQLPAASSVNPASAIIVDDGGPVKKATPSQVVDAATPLASQAEAEAGLDNAKRVTPLRVKQAIDALGVGREALASPDPGKGAALVGVSSSETAADVFAQEVRITTFGAKFDVGEVADIASATDDTDAWEAAFAHLRSIGGGTLRLPPGASKTTRMIDIPIDVPVRIVGTGTQKVYPGNFAAGRRCPSTVVPVHGGRCAFRFKATANGHGGFIGESFNLNAIVIGPVPDCAFGWETAGFFPYGFTFRQMGIHNFRKPGNLGAAFEVYRPSGSENAVGAVLISDCTINHNNWIARTLGNTQFNGFRFVFNKAGQNGYVAGTGGINVAGHDVAIENNILEGMRDPVRIYGSYRDTNVRGNYFEANVGDYCIALADVRSFNVGPNYFFATNGAAHKVLLSYTGFGTCSDPYWSNGTHKMDLPLLGAFDEHKLNNAAENYGLLRFDRFDGRSYSKAPSYLTAAGPRVAIAARSINPQTGNPMPVQEYVTAGTGIIQMTQGITGTAGQWVAVCIPFRRVPDEAGAASHPLLSLNVNNAGAAGTQDLPGYNFATYWQDGEWVLLTAATKLGAAMTTLGIYFYPWGLNPAAGRKAQFLRPFAYTVDDVNKIVPYMDNPVAESIAAAPTAGTWNAGDTLRRAAGGFFVCTASGTPGTWGTIVPA